MLKVFLTKSAENYINGYKLSLFEPLSIYNFKIKDERALIL